MNPRRTRIVATIGPASDSPEVLGHLVGAGLDVARLNFSHGTRQQHANVIARIRSAAVGTGRHVTILGDLSGPKVRIGEIRAGQVQLASGQEFTLTSQQVAGDQHLVSISHPALPEEVMVNDSILLADGSIELVVRETTASTIRCEVLVGGQLSSHKGVNVPSRALSVASLTEKDREDAEFGLLHGVDMFALSFVRHATDLVPLQELVRSSGLKVPVIAKIETARAIDNLHAIVQAADGIMVARGDLAVEISFARVPLVQKRIIAACNAAGKPVITATQMLQSMVASAHPTRAEAADVANAVLDGADALMLSEETAVGVDPARAVSTMARIIAATEADRTLEPGAAESPHAATPAGAIARSATMIAQAITAKVIVAPTITGTTARLVAAHRPTQPILALCPDPQVVRALGLVWGVTALVVGTSASVEEAREIAVAACRSTGLAASGDRIVLTGGFPVGVAGGTNMITTATV